MAERYPFSLDLKIDERYVVSQLAELWPEDPEWTAQAYDLWERIDAVIHSIPGIAGTPEAILRLSAALSPIAPPDIPDPNEIAAVAVFDSVSGMLRHGLILPMPGSPPNLQALTIPAGLVLICQSLVRASEQTTDMPDSELGTGTNLYSEHNRGETTFTDDVKANPEAKQVASPVPQNDSQQNKKPAVENNAEKEAHHPPPAEHMPPPQPS